MQRTIRMTALALSLLPTAAGAIVGGTEGGPLASATIMVLNDRGGICTAIILDADAVLTAGHCVAGAGQVRLHWRGTGEPVLKEPAGVALHPGYNGRAIAERTRSVDLALVRLKEPLPHYFAAASLLAGAQPRAGARLVVGGYGATLEADPRTTGTYRSVAVDVTEPYGPGKLVLWASGGSGASNPAARGASDTTPRGASNTAPRGACAGDSGGPMLAGESVAAVTTWSTGTGKAKCGALTQGILLAPQRDWIDRTLKGWGRRANWAE